MKWKITLGLLSALILLTVLGTAVYQVTIAEAKDREQNVAEQAEARLKKNSNRRTSGSSLSLTGNVNMSFLR